MRLSTYLLFFPREVAPNGNPDSEHQVGHFVRLARVAEKFYDLHVSSVLAQSSSEM